MFFDEDNERRGDRRDAMLNIPITDFELSVRSRNCLKKMNIKSLGDLLRTSEQELLSYKNFGETSLNEIKALLAAKGMRLGQAAEEGKTPVLRRPSVNVGNVAPGDSEQYRCGPGTVGPQPQGASTPEHRDARRACQPHRGRTARLQELRAHELERDQAAVGQLRDDAAEA